MNKIKTLIIFIFLLVLAVPCFAETLGQTTKQGTTNTGFRFYGTKVTAPENGAITSISAFIKATNSTTQINYGYYLLMTNYLFLKYHVYHQVC